MIIVKLRVTREMTAAHWKEVAKGVTDEYGNPFRIIKVRWNQSRMHRMSEYAKTRGFEDTVITKDRRTGDVAIQYRRKGSIMWQRPMGGVGSFIGEVAYTPFNLQKLISMHGDKLWTILDDDIRVIVEKGYAKRLTEMPVKVRDFNQTRIMSMHTMNVEKGDNVASDFDKQINEVEKQSVTEQNRMNMIKAQELAVKEEALNMKENAIDNKIADMAIDGVAPVAYSEEYLVSKKYLELRGICKTIGVKYTQDDKKDTLIAKIMEKQEGNKQAVEEKMASIVGSDSLED